MFDGAQVAQDAVQGVLSRVDQLAAKLGVGAQKLWEIYTFQARVEAVRDFVFAALFLGVSFLLFKLIPIFWEKYLGSGQRGYDQNCAWATAAILSGIGIIPLVGIALGSLYSGLGEYLNPQYWAFQHITVDLKNLF